MNLQIIQKMIEHSKKCFEKGNPTKGFVDVIVNNYPTKSNYLEDLAKSNGLGYKRFLMQYLDAQELKGYLDKLESLESERITMIHFDMERNLNNIYNPSLETINQMLLFYMENRLNPKFHIYITHPDEASETYSNWILCRMDVIDFSKHNLLKCF